MRWRRQSAVEGELRLEFDERAAHHVARSLLELREAFGRGGRARRHLLGLRPEDVGREHVVHRGFVDRLDRVLQKQTVAPRGQVRQILHHHVVLVCEGACPSDGVGVEGLREDGLVAVVDPLLARDLLRGQLVFGRAQEFDERFDVRHVAVTERDELPPSLGRRAAIRRRRVKHVVKPLLSLGESLAFAQVHGDGDGDVIKEFPVVTRVGAPRRDVDLVRTAMDLSHAVRMRRVLALEEKSILERLQELWVEHARDGLPIELRDQRLDERMRKVLERVGEPVGVAPVHVARRCIGAVVKSRGVLQSRSVHRLAPAWLEVFVTRPMGPIMRPS